MYLSTRDMARIGLLMLTGGNWNDTRFRLGRRNLGLQVPHLRQRVESVLAKRPWCGKTRSFCHTHFRGQCLSICHSSSAAPAESLTAFHGSSSAQPSSLAGIRVRRNPTSRDERPSRELAIQMTRLSRTGAIEESTALVRNAIHRTSRDISRQTARSRSRSSGRALLLTPSRSDAMALVPS